MQYQHTNDTYILKIEKGETVLETLTAFCSKQAIANATITGLGAVDWIECGYYALDEQVYHFKKYEGLFEVLNLTGNCILKDGEPFIHMHALFSDTSNQVFGGHVSEMRVGVVLEVILHKLETQIERTYDTATGLHLMDLT